MLNGCHDLALCLAVAQVHKDIHLSQDKVVGVRGNAGTEVKEPVNSVLVTVPVADLWASVQCPGDVHASVGPLGDVGHNPRGLGFDPQLGLEISLDLCPLSHVSRVGAHCQALQGDNASPFGTLNLL